MCKICWSLAQQIEFRFERKISSDRHAGLFWGAFWQKLNLKAKNLLHLAKFKPVIKSYNLENAKLKC